MVILFSVSFYYSVAMPSVLVAVFGLVRIGVSAMLTTNNMAYACSTTIAVVVSWSISCYIVWVVVAQASITCFVHISSESTMIRCCLLALHRE